MPDARLKRTREAYDEVLFLHAEGERVMRLWQRAMNPQDLDRVLATVNLVPSPEPSEQEPWGV